MNDLSFVLVIFFVTLGPIKVIAAFAQLTSQLPDGERRALALRSTLIATAVGFLILFIGDNLRQNWQIASPDLLLTGGVLLLIGALEAVKNAQHAPAPDAPPTSAKGLAMSPVTFPIIITPYGIVALLLFFYGLAVAPFTYMLSFLFKSHSTAQNAVLLLNFISGLILMIASFVMQYIESTTAINAKLVYVYRLFPGFCLGNGLLMLTEQNLLDLEREAFLSLCGEEKSQARMQHMLQTGKPLRN